MRKIGSKLAVAALAASMFAPGAVLAQTAPANAVISNGTVALGVGSDAGLATSGTGLLLQSASAEGLAAPCACSGWSLSLNGPPLSARVESFTFTPTGAMSVIHVTDPGQGVDL